MILKDDTEIEVLVPYTEICRTIFKHKYKLKQKSTFLAKDKILKRSYESSRFCLETTTIKRDTILKVNTRKQQGFPARRVRVKTANLDSVRKGLHKKVSLDLSFGSFLNHKALLYLPERQSFLSYPEIRL